MDALPNSVYIPVHVSYAVLFQSRERDQDCFAAVLCAISACNMIISRATRVIWDVYSVLFSRHLPQVLPL